MHGEAIGIGKTPMVALSYALVALVLYVCAAAGRRAAPKAAAAPAGHGSLEVASPAASF